MDEDGERQKQGEGDERTGYEGGVHHRVQGYTDVVDLHERVPIGLGRSGDVGYRCPVAGSIADLFGDA